MMSVTVLVNFNTAKKYFIFIMTDNESILNGLSRWSALDLIKNRSWLLLLIAVVVSISSYAASLFVAERKRGVV